MTLKIRYLRGARRNARDISDWIRRENPAAAARVGRRIQDVVGRLAERPAMGSPGRVAGTRETKIPGLAYRIVYRVVTSPGDDILEVLRIQHEARDEQPPDWPEPR